jgi:hypothetical protein
LVKGLVRDLRVVMQASNQTKDWAFLPDASATHNPAEFVVSIHQELLPPMPASIQRPVVHVLMPSTVAMGLAGLACGGSLLLRRHRGAASPT